MRLPMPFELRSNGRLGILDPANLLVPSVLRYLCLGRYNRKRRYISLFLIDNMASANKRLHSVVELSVGWNLSLNNGANLPSSSVS